MIQGELLQDGETESVGIIDETVLEGAEEPKPFVKSDKVVEEIDLPSSVTEQQMEVEANRPKKKYFLFNGII